MFEKMKEDQNRQKVDSFPFVLEGERRSEQAGGWTVSYVFERMKEDQNRQKDGQFPMY